MIQEHPSQFRYMVAYLLQDKKEGEFFDKSILHISVLPWFRVNIPETQLVESFRKEFLGLPHFEAELGPKVMFGPNHTVPVSLVESKRFEPMHYHAMEWLAEIHAGWEDELVYVAKDYKAHVRWRNGFDFHPGQILDIDSIVLIKASEDLQDERRQVLAKVNLNE